LLGNVADLTNLSISQYSPALFDSPSESTCTRVAAFGVPFQDSLRINFNPGGFFMFTVLYK